MALFVFASIIIDALSSCNNLYSAEEKHVASKDSTAQKDSMANELPTILDTNLYKERLVKITNGDSSGRWPVKSDYPKAGAILPFKRIVAYYGNFYSKKMGVLGEYPAPEMLQKLKIEIKKWEAADSSTAVQPALHYIAVTAQGSPGKDGKYRLRMPFKQIDSVINLAAQINAIVFLDVQVGMSNVKLEIPLLEKYLKMPQVHLGIDPEFSMKTGKKPGTVIGTMDAEDINFASTYLKNLVVANNLPPKILVVHRFTQGMLTNYKKVETHPEVQVVMDMDGWGIQARKINTYKEFISKQPVEYTGFKLFYKNDFREANSRMLTPEEVLKLKPQPMYIQYQ
ncbi:MAG: hypothetical protein JST87_11880 [Bacteroidetes bacterium]|nr:hypothetical protein [Bacteroidota bacterium]